VSGGLHQTLLGGGLAWHYGPSLIKTKMNIDEQALLFELPIAVASSVVFSETANGYSNV
jgi:hypothetical protein